MVSWHILSGEYPPQPGGVSDYTQSVAYGLIQAGDEVHVWTPASSSPSRVDLGVSVHRLPDHYGPLSLAVLSASLKYFPQPHRILVQYVPHAFGWKALNVPFCLWLLSRRKDPVWVMFHEVYFPMNWKQPLTHNALGSVTRLMAMLVAQAAERMFVSIPMWKELLKPLTSKHEDIIWLPVPSSVPVVVDPFGVKAIRARYAHGTGEFIIGHFGTYGRKIADLMRSLVPSLILNHDDCTMLLLGRGGQVLRDELIQQYPDLIGKVYATGALSAADISRHLSACDVMVQPFVDGVSSRRTTVMAGLAHGLPIVTTKGFLTETLWAESCAVALAEVGDIEGTVAATRNLLEQVPERTRMGKAAKVLYQEHFDIRHTITALRESRIEGTNAT